MIREYLRITPSSERLDPDPVSSSLQSLYKLSVRGKDSALDRLNPFSSEVPVTFEFLAISEGRDEPVEFYFGADARLDVLEQRLHTIYPASFDIDRVEVDSVRKLLRPVEYQPSELRDRLTESRLYDPEVLERRLTNNELGSSSAGTIEARPPLDEVTPRGVRWQGSVDRRKDWMTTLDGLTKRLSGGPDSGKQSATRTGRAPLAPLVDQLTEAEQPMAYQVLFRRKRDWSRQARRRSGALLAGKDTLLQKVLSLESPGPRRFGPRGYSSTGNHSNRVASRWETPPLQGAEMRDRERDQKTTTRLDLLRENTPKRSFTVNARLLALPRTGEEIENLEARLENLCSAFDPIDGPYYEIDGSRFRAGSLLTRRAERRAKNELEQFRTRTIDTRSLDQFPWPTNRADTRPDLVLNADELANLVTVPSATDLTVEGGRGTRAEQQSRNPLPRPDHDTVRQLRQPGLELGHLLDENGEPEEQPVRLPPDLLPFHVGRFAKTGAGKSIALINDALSLYDQTSGPVFLIDTKGGGLPEHYMRAHAERFGFDDLEANVLHFDIPEILPGFAFFNIEPALANGVPRLQAIKDRADHYEELLKMTMGEERYEQAVVSPNLLKYLIRLMYDEEYGLQHGNYRESVNYFGQSQLEQVVDQLYAAGPPQSAPEEAPQSSSEEVTSKIHRHLTADPQTFANIMGGVSHRMDYITSDPFLRQIFDTTEPRFDIREVLDEDMVVVFDLGDLRTDAAKVMAGVILTNLYDAVTERGPTELARTPEDYVANLLIDEASSIVVSEILNDLLEKGREFQLSVELVSQFPEQMELEGDRGVYLNVLNNIGSPIVGKIAVDDEIARALAHEELDPPEFRNRVRALPRGEWIAQVPGPTFGETGPMPFSVAPLPIPPGHPESGQPLTTEEERRFEEALESVRESTQLNYGVPADGSISAGTVPDALVRTLQLGSDGVDDLLAVMTRYVQLQHGVRTENGWVPVREVDELLESWYDVSLPEDGADRAKDGDDVLTVPTRADLAEIRDRSPLFELSIDTDRDVTLIRLTESGQVTAASETGTVQAAGNDAHDGALQAVERILTRHGYLVAPVRQDGGERPDAWAFHPEAEVPLAIEIETTTHTKPTKVLTNLRRAQERGAVPVFVVPTTDGDTDGSGFKLASRIANILDEPIKRQGVDGDALYISTEHVSYNGGARADNGLTSVRPVSIDGGSNRTIWRREAGEYVLLDAAGTVHARVEDIDTAPKEQFPATYSYDPETGSYTVFVPGELPQSYESEGSFRDHWVPVKRPFIPETDLPVPEYDRDSYVITLLAQTQADSPDGETCLDVYREGETKSFEWLTSALRSGTVCPAGAAARAKPEDVRDVPLLPTGEESATDSDEDGTVGQVGEPLEVSAPNAADVGVAEFADARLVVDDENIVPFREVYEAYEAFAEERGFENKAATHFTPVLKEEMPVESKRKWLDGKARQCYFGVDLVDPHRDSMTVRSDEERLADD